MPRPKALNKKVQCTFKIPKNLLAEFRNHCEQNKITMISVVEKAIEKEIETCKK
jgi:hypothetical protein